MWMTFQRYGGTLKATAFFLGVGQKKLFLHYAKPPVV